MTTKQAADIIRMLLGYLKGEIEPPKQETIEEARAFEQQGYECLEMAIKALETVSCIKEKCAYCPHCENCDVDDETLEIKALEQQPCEDWYDVPSNEMTLEQARQAVKDLRKKLAEYLEQQPCEDAVNRQAVHDLIAELLSDYLHDEDREKIEKLDVKIEDLEPVTPKEKSEYEHDHEVVKAYNDGQAYILDKIRAEVEILGKDYLGCPQPQVVCDDVIKIIDKYRGE